MAPLVEMVDHPRKSQKIRKKKKLVVSVNVDISRKLRQIKYPSLIHKIYHVPLESR